MLGSTARTRSAGARRQRGARDDARGAPGGGDGGGSVYLKMDSRQHRIAVHPSDRDNGCAYAGWEYANPDDFEARRRRGGRGGRRGDQAVGNEDAAARGVRRLARFDDPFGNSHELFFGQAVDEDPFVSPKGVSGFLTDGVGVGHVLYVVPNSWDAANFFVKALGFKLTDWFTWGPNNAIFCTRRAATTASRSSTSTSRAARASTTSWSRRTGSRTSARPTTGPRPRASRSSTRSASTPTTR